MELSLLLAADYANTTADGKLNVMGIFKNIKTLRFPATQPEMYLVMQLEASPAEYDRAYTLSVKLLDEDAIKALVDININRTVPRGKDGQVVHQNVLARLNGVKFPRAGTYEFSVLVDNDVKGTLAIDIQQIDASQMPRRPDADTDPSDLSLN